MKTPFCTAIAICFLSLLSAPLFAETRALLVGVSDYDDKIGLADLKGPANDVRLLRDVLSRRGIDDITILADGVESGAVPTRAAILGAFEALADTAKNGDFIYIHLSGHGTRQGDLNGDETDGLDEVFLPADTARAESGVNQIPNAIVDDEIGAAVNAIRETGANVWLVMDSCHSGSGLRAATVGVATRFVDPVTLGVSVKASGAVEAQISAENGAEPAGGFLAFYAAQSDELARELNIEKATGGEAWYGLFSSKLAARLDNDNALSFRQLFQAVMSDMKSGSTAGALQTPLWEGNLIDAAVFGGADTAGIQRFAVRADEVFAGLVHGLGDGTLLGLVADAADPPDAIIGFAQMEASEATRAFLRPVAAGCIPNSVAPCPFEGALPKGAQFAQVIARPVDLELRIAAPVDGASGVILPEDHPAQVALREAIVALKAEKRANVRISEADATIASVFVDGDLWFGPRAMQGRTPVGLSAAISDGNLTARLERIAKAEELAVMLGSVSSSGSLLNPNPVEIKAALSAVDINDLAAKTGQMSPARECRGAVGRAQSRGAVPLPIQADLKQCDQITFSAQGKVAGARDVNRIHIDSQFCIHADYEKVEDSATPRLLGQQMTVCSDCPNGYSAGDERLFVIITESAKNADVLNLKGLIENCEQNGATRGTAAGQAQDFLTRIAKRPDTRGSFGGLDIANIWVEQFSWRVQPRAEAFVRAGRIEAVD